MWLRYAYRIDPAPGQRIALAKAFGCARVVFNDAIKARRDAHEAGLPFISDGELSKQVVTRAKLTPQRAWLGEVSAVILQQALADACQAYRSFFASLTGKRKGPKIAPPRFRSRKDARQAVRFTKNARFAITGQGRLRLPKIGDVKVRWSRPLPAEPSSVTVIKDAAGRYFASFVVEVGGEPLPQTPAEVGIDLGLRHFAVLSDGRKIDAPRFLRQAEKKLKRLQRSLSRKEQGSANRVKVRRKIARQHARVADARREFCHQLSTKIIRENQAVYVEDLAVKGLARTRLAKSVHDAGWSQFVAMLQYKATLYGRTVVKTGRFFPSSKLCSACGVLAEHMPMSTREWQCACGIIHDRDINAARNILAAGRTERLNACGGQVRPPLAAAQADEAGSQGSATAGTARHRPKSPC